MQYTGKHLSDAEFKRLHSQHIASEWWRDTFRPAALRHYGFKCAECGKEYEKRGISGWRLIVDHRRYWKDGRLIFGHETFADVRLLCPPHNRKGVRKDEVLAISRMTHLLWKCTVWLIGLPAKVLWRTTKKLTKKIIAAVSQTRPPFGSL